MKPFKISLLVFACMLSSTIFSQQITVDGKVTPKDLIENHLIQGCVETSSITSPVNGSKDGFSSFGSFDRGSSNFPFKNGIVLTTGKAEAGGNGLNSTTLSYGSNTWGTDVDLESTLGITNTLNATAIEFEFASTSNQLQFNYLLASEEYSGLNPCYYSDAFAILIKPADNSAPFKNIALIPGTNTPVTTQTIRNGVFGHCQASNIQYFDNEDFKTPKNETNYRGRTQVMTAGTAILPNVKYIIKIVIADQDDKGLDSAVFIQRENFEAKVDLGDDVSTCENTISLDGTIGNPVALYTWYLNDTIITGESQPTLKATVSGKYTVKIEAPLFGSTCTIEDSIMVQLSAAAASPVSIGTFERCDDASGDGVETFTFSKMGIKFPLNKPESEYKISFHDNFVSAQSGVTINTKTVSINAPRQIFAKVEDKITGCLAYYHFELLVNPIPTIPSKPVTICNDNRKSGLTIIDADKILDITEKITLGNSNLNVSYYRTKSDAIAKDPIKPFSIGKSENLYVVIEDLKTGCTNEGTITLEVLDTPVINTTDRHYIDACDMDHDGYAMFDLTSMINAITYGAAYVSTNFFEIDANGQEGQLILNPGAYNNKKANREDVLVKVTNASGCSSIAVLELHTNVLLTGTLVQQYSICDDGKTPFFDLYDVEKTIANDLPKVSVIFYESNSDRINNIPINKNVPYTQSSFPHKLIITLDNTVCTETTEIEFIVNPIIDFPSIGKQVVCDTDQDGKTPVKFSDFNDYVTHNQKGYSVQYFLESDTVLKNPIADLTDIKSQIIYTKVTSSKTGCSDLKSFKLIIYPAPETNKATDIIICDNDQDGFSIVNLDSKIKEMVPNLTDRAVTFHTTKSDADNNSSPISGTANFNAKTQTIYTRVENTITGCHSVEPIKIIVNTLPIIPNISIYKYCEDHSDGIGNFTFSTKDVEILNGQKGKQVFYFKNQIDAVNRNITNAIDKNKSQALKSQTIYIRVENITDEECHTIGSFSIEVGSNPIFNLPSDYYKNSSWYKCDFGNDGEETFNLNEIADVIKGTIKGLTVTFYKDALEAETGSNQLPLSYTISKDVTTERIYARIDNGSICKPVVSFNIGLTDPPEIKEQPKPLIKCDIYDSPTSNTVDGKVVFNLKDAKVEIINNRYVEHKYYEDEQATQEIKSPTAFESGSKTVYLRLTNNKTGCYLNVPIELIVNLPETKSFQTALCVNTGPVTLDPELSNSGDSYVWSTGQKTREIKVNKIGTYSVRVTTKSGCITNYIYEVIASAPAKIDFTEHIDFSDPNNIKVTVSGIGNYEYTLKNREYEVTQLSNVFENVPIGLNIITVTDLNGCGETTKDVLVLDTPKFMTPNDDGYFDTWHITGVKTLPGTVIKIFDRYGKQLARLTATSPGWDGTFNGQKMPSTDYWFVADVKKKDGTAFQLTGHFALKR